MGVGDRCRFGRVAQDRSIHHPACLVVDRRRHSNTSAIATSNESSGPNAAIFQAMTAIAIAGLILGALFTWWSIAKTCSIISGFLTDDPMSTVCTNKYQAFFSGIHSFMWWRPKRWALTRLFKHTVCRWRGHKWGDTGLLLGSRYADAWCSRCDFHAQIPIEETKYADMRNDP